jgi:hypothetical protein
LREDFALAAFCARVSFSVDLMPPPLSLEAFSERARTYLVI